MKAKWREYLNGKVHVKDVDKMNWEIRRRTKQMMKDLLLITKQMSQQQRELIFQPETRDKLVIPLVRKLVNNASVGRGQKKYEAIARLARSLEIANIRYDWVKLVEDKNYRDRKEVHLKSVMSTFP